jgi:hypothetical protein
MPDEHAEISQEMFTVIKDCLDTAAPSMAKRYRIPVETVRAMFPRILINAAFDRELKQHKWTDDEIKQLCCGVYLRLDCARMQYHSRKDKCQ